MGLIWPSEPHSVSFIIKQMVQIAHLKVRQKFSFVAHSELCKVWTTSVDMKLNT